jgi:hypothetical protein
VNTSLTAKSVTCADHGSRHGEVVPDDPVLDRVRYEEQDDQVQGVRLPELPLADEPQGNDEEQIDEQGAKDLLAGAELQVEEVLPHPEAIRGPARESFR